MARTLAVCAVALGLLLPRPAVADAPKPDFDRVIAPLLTRRCLDCHRGPKASGGLDLARRKSALAGGDNGAAIAPGAASDSLLWQRVRDGEMPPKKPLSDDEKTALKTWIDAGARWGSDPIDPFRLTTDRRAGYDWWALQPVARPPAPAVKDRAWVRNPIDAFVLERLEGRGLAPSPEAGRRTLIRRLAFDLLGLPPAPEEVEAFVADKRPDAYEKLVDRLLASPHYGERWARHFLDVVRFGESDGFERDLPRPNAWPYRDWVIDALNADLPYDEFVRLQLAGDLLRPEDPAAVAATGFLVAGPHDIVVPVGERMKAAMRQDELEDVVGTVGQAFLGLTVHCARCHDHKFDPLAQKDYYRLAASLAGVRHGERGVVSASDRAALADLRRRADELGRTLADLEAPARRAALAARKDGKAGSAPKPIAEWDFQIDLKDRVGALHGKTAGAARLDAAGLVLDGKTGYVATEPLKVDLREKTLEAWVRLDRLDQRGGGVMTVQTLDGNAFDAIVFGEQEAGRWLAGSDFFRRTQPLGGPAEAEADKRPVHLAIAYDADGAVRAYRDGEPYGKPYQSGGPASFKAGAARVVFGVRHQPAGGNKMLAGAVVRARLYDRALSADEVAVSAGSGVSEDELLAQLGPDDRTRRRDVKKERARLAADAARLEARAAEKVFAVVLAEPGPTHLLLRGSIDARSDLVAPAPPAALEKLGPTLKPDASDAERRLALAKWITAPENPLFARVAVNRLWHHHFGVGLVDTPSDLGFNGGRPTHPALLDWLASESVRQKFSLKALHRTIVLSATYRQASAPRPEALKIDADNRLLWRRSPQRLEAEAVRDAVLAVSGELDRTVGGRDYQDFRSYFFKGTQFYDPVEQVGPGFTRRTVYRQWARGGRSPFLDAFDCPDPSAATPRRATTTTPLQALALLNNAFVLHQAERFAGRVRKEAGDDVEKQIGRAFALACGRSPDKEELAVVKPFVAKHGLAAFCRVLFNGNEFLTID